MALELIIHAGDKVTLQRSCLEDGCGVVWENIGQNTHCPKCNSTNIRTDDIGYKNGDIITLDYSPSPWSTKEKRTVVYMSDDEVAKLITNLGFESEDDLWAYLDTPKRSVGFMTARRAYKITCPFINEDGNFINIAASDVVRK